MRMMKSRSEKFISLVLSRTSPPDDGDTTDLRFPFALSSSSSERM